MKGLVNTVFGWILSRRTEQIRYFMENPYEVQEKVLRSLINAAAGTEFGKKHHFRKIKTYQDFQHHVPVRSYEEFKPWIDRILKGEQNVIWPTPIKWFAKSSGTTGGRSKFIPVSQEALEDCHFKGGKDMFGLYYEMQPEANIAYGKSLVLGGSHEINKINNQSSYGDISAVLMQNLPFWAQLKRAPDLKIALMDNWEEKIEKMALQTLEENITVILGVPTWTVVLIQKLFDITGKTNLADIWPNLELYVHGGVSFAPYSGLFENLIRKDKMFYLETYNASEGFFGIQDQAGNKDMLLMLDYGIFYEFEDLETGEITWLDGVKQDRNYALLITTNAGLWRYRIGDTIRFASLNPFRIRISGRTKQFINAFGEEVIVENAESALVAACNKTNAEIHDYTAGPVFLSSNSRGAHEWLIEFKKQPQNLEEFSIELDASLRNINSDYDAKRQKDMALTMPKVHSLERGTFNEWLKSKGKLGGQNKVPRLSNDRKVLDDVLGFVNKSSSKLV